MHLNLDIDIQYLIPPPQAAALRVRGEIDLATAGDLRDALTRQFTAGYTDVLLDLVGVTFMDSSGLRLFEWARTQAQSVGGRLVLDPVSQPVRRFLTVAGARPLLA